MGARARRDLVWTRHDADALIGKLVKRLHGIVAVGLTGSLLTSDSGNDLDIIFYPFSSETPSETIREAVSEALVSEGFSLTYPVDAVHRHWRTKGSADRKHVEIWRGPGKRKLDAFILR